ncbi:MAG TPA: PH domain-containing protein [Pseudonocardia sp.]|nr:PH domain-containing protein [Pseudonocardia sp.]
MALTPAAADDRAREWSPAAGLVALCWLGALAALGWCALLWTTYADPAGRLIAGLAAVGLLVAAVVGTRARPRLRVDEHGLTVGGVFGTRHHPWPLVADVRVLQMRRMGLRRSLLEVDTLTPGGDEGLLVFGRLELAEDPEDVAPQVLALRPARGRPTG